MKKIGALEAGGTKMVLAVYDEAGQELERLTLPTETPDKTMPPMQAFFRNHGIDALGVGSFGPLALGKDDPNYGAITTTPKLAWRNYPLLQRLTEAGNTVLVIEHNLDVIKVADHIIDLGPEGGDLGGELVFAGTPEDCAKCERSYTGQFLKPLLEK